MKTIMRIFDTLVDGVLVFGSGIVCIVMLVDQLSTPPPAIEIPSIKVLDKTKIILMSWFTQKPKQHRPLPTVIL